MLQMLILNNPKIRAAVGIPLMVQHPTPTEEQKKTSALDNFKTSK